MKSLIVALAIAIVLGVHVPQSHASTDVEREFVQLINQDRLSNGLSELEVDEELSELARRHSETMVISQELHHNEALSSQVDGWMAIGENVGRGPSAESIQRAFMNSTEHRDNILRPRWNIAGVGVVEVNEVFWVTQVFVTHREDVEVKSSYMFKDQSTIDEVHVDAVMRLAGLGIVDGYQDGTFKPDEPVTRQQLASMLDRLLDSLTEP